MTALANVPARAILRALAQAAERWSDADFPPRVRASDRIAQRTGYAPPVVDYALDRLFFSITQDDLLATIRDELGSLDALDGFAPRPHRPDAWAHAVGSVCVISSRTTIGVALLPAIFALCAKCDVLVKDREDALIAAFFETLREERDDFGDAARAEAWSGTGSGADLARFDAVVAFGSDATLTAIAGELPHSTRWIGYGSRASAGYVTRQSMNEHAVNATIAPGAARDLVLYESEGCLSLHVLFVERGGEIELERFCRRLADCVEAANVEFPIGARATERTTQIAHKRDLAAFRRSSGTGDVLSNAAADFAVIVDPPLSQPPHFLPRTLGVLGVDEPAQALVYLRDHRIPLEGFALSALRDDVVRMAIDAGAVRLARFGELQHPPLTGHHGGRPRIAQFVRWIDRAL